MGHGPRAHAETGMGVSRRLTPADSRCSQLTPVRLLAGEAKLERQLDAALAGIATTVTSSVLLALAHRGASKWAQGAARTARPHDGGAAGTIRLRLAACCRGGVPSCSADGCEGCGCGGTGETEAGSGLGWRGRRLTLRR